MKNYNSFLRIAFGLFLLFFGLNGFLQFMAFPEVGPEAGIFLGAINSTQIFFPIIAIVEVIAGLLLLIKRAVPFALVLIFPILLCAFLYHLTLDIKGIPFALLGLIFNILMAFSHREKYKVLF